MMIIYINALDDGDDDGNNVHYDDASSDDDEDDGDDTYHKSHKSVEQCEWAAGFYHLHTNLTSTSTSTNLTSTSTSTNLTSTGTLLLVAVPVTAPISTSAMALQLFADTIQFPV